MSAVSEIATFQSWKPLTLLLAYDWSSFTSRANGTYFFIYFKKASYFQRVKKNLVSCFSSFTVRQYIFIKVHIHTQNVLHCAPQLLSLALHQDMCKPPWACMSFNAWGQFCLLCNRLLSLLLSFPFFFLQSVPVLCHNTVPLVTFSPSELIFIMRLSAPPAKEKQLLCQGELR